GAVTRRVSVVGGEVRAGRGARESRNATNNVGSGDETSKRSGRRGTSRPRSARVEERDQQRGGAVTRRVSVVGGEVRAGRGARESRNATNNVGSGDETNMRSGER